MAQGPPKRRIPTDQRAALDRAVSAGRTGDERSFLQGLVDSRLLDGLVRELESRYHRHIHRHDVEGLVADATDALYAALKSGKRVIDPAAFLYRTARYMAYDLHQRRKLDIPVEPGRPSPLDRLPAEEPSAEAPLDENLMRVRALQFARALLPELGQENVQKVMAYVIEAAANGATAEDVSNEKLMEVLGLSYDTVRTSLSRGWRRLARIAKERRLALTVFEEMGMQARADDEEIG